MIHITAPQDFHARQPLHITLYIHACTRCSIHAYTECYVNAWIGCYIIAYSGCHINAYIACFVNAYILKFYSCNVNDVLDAMFMDVAYGV